MASWQSLPPDLKHSIINFLGSEDIGALAKANRASYRACVPARFRSVKLSNIGALSRFLKYVSRSNCARIETLEVTTHDEDLSVSTYISLRQRSDAVITLLSACHRLVSLTLRTAGSLHNSIISPFPFLSELKELSISNVGSEDTDPLGERVVVAIAASCQNLQNLSLDRITRSELHAPELQGVPYIPLVRDKSGDVDVPGDMDVPDHPLLGPELRLPSLLRIPTLRKLTIRDTHLGDEHWSITPIACRLEVLDLGICYHENEDFNSICVERILAAVGPTLDEVCLTTAVSDSKLFARPSETPLQKMRKLHITPFFPIDNIIETLSNLAGSPIEKLSIRCYEDDVVDACTVVEEFLALKMERGTEFYQKLSRIDVSVVVAGYSLTEEEVGERTNAAKRLQDFCRQLRLSSGVEGYGVPQRPVIASRRFSTTDVDAYATQNSLSSLSSSGFTKARLATIE